MVVEGDVNPNPGRGEPLRAQISLRKLFTYELINANVYITSKNSSNIAPADVCSFVIGFQQ